MYAAIYHLLKSGAQTKMGGAPQPNINSIDFLTLFLAIAIYLVIVLLLGTWIWNAVLVKIIPGIGMIDHWYELLFIIVLFHMIFPSSYVVTA